MHEFFAKIVCYITPYVYHCDKQEYCNRVDDFSPVNNFVNRIAILLGMVINTSDSLKLYTMK